MALLVARQARVLRFVVCGSMVRVGSWSSVRLACLEEDDIQIARAEWGKLEEALQVYVPVLTSENPAMGDDLQLCHFLIGKISR